MKTKKPQGPFGQGRWHSIFLLAFFWLIFVWLLNQQMGTKALELAYSDFKSYVQQGQVAEVAMQGQNITGRFKKAVQTGTPDNGKTYERFATVFPSVGDPQLLPTLEAQQVTIRTEQEKSSWLGAVLITLLPWALILGLFLYGQRKMSQGIAGGGGFFSFGKSRARRYEKTQSEVTFADVAGLNNAKKELQEIIAYLQDPSRFRTLGGELPKGVLLVGPPGIGKTLLARASAGEAQVPFYSTSGSEFIEMFVGVGASRVRDMFRSAKQEAPAIIFIDEIDSIGRARGTGLGGGHDEREQTLNQILSEMDGFAPHQAVVVMAATNRPDVLDPALTRPGRFDRQVTLDLPQRQARLAILRLHTRKIPLANDVNLETIAAKTTGFSGADLKNLVNEAALLAGRFRKERVHAQDIAQARDKILLGIERDEPLSDEEKRLVAYHEAGHALVARLLPDTDPVQKISIIPRGRALGATEQVPEEDRHNLRRAYLLSRIAVMLGGRAAEKLIFQEVTTGAGDDLKKATQLARRMVCQWGMSEKLGAVTFHQSEEHVFLGREISEQRDFSEYTARLIDEEVQHIIVSMEQRADSILAQHRDMLEAFAEALLEHETLEADDIDRLLGVEAEGLSVSV